MTSRSDLALRIALGLSLAGCGLTRPADPPPFDCEAIDRADERFPDECGEPIEEEDAGEPVEEEDAGEPVEDEDAGEPGAEDDAGGGDPDAGADEPDGAST